MKTLTGGTSPVLLLADACERIRRGDADVVLIGGVECFDVLMRAMKEGRDPGFAGQDEAAAPDRLVGSAGETSHPLELAAGLIAPVAYYPLFESALRAGSGRDPAEHQEYLGRLWARFAEAAASNPHAWTRDAPGAEQIATASAANRQVTIPYTKLMNSNIQTNQAAALVICADSAAEAAGIDPSTPVHIRATATANDRAFPSERQRLDRSPALAACGEAVLGHVGSGIEQIDHLDIYSCFPSAVGVACRELGIDPFDQGRSPTTTGGLSFAGGPGSNYVTHSIAALCERIASDGGHALATAVGWYLTKHGVVALSDRPGTKGWEHFEPQSQADSGRPIEVVAPPGSGTAAVEAYTAICNREGDPELGIATFRIGETRTVAKADDPASLAVLAERDCLGLEAVFTGDGRFALS